MVAVNRIFRYLKGTDEYGLLYPHKGDFSLSVFIDSYWVGNIDDRKSTSGGAFFLGDRIVSWTRKKQNYISQFIAEAEYVAVVINCTQIVWIKQLLEGIQEKVTKPMTIHCENTSAIVISKNLVMHFETKHKAIKYHYLRE